MNYRGSVATILLVLSSAASSATFVVNQVGDQSDGDLSDNMCDVDPLVEANQCTLRAAIEQSNETEGMDYINFIDLGPIRPASALPTIWDPVLIDGYIGNSSKKNTYPTGMGLDAMLEVELDGENAGIAPGLWIQAPNSVVRGLAIYNFDTGITIGNMGGGSVIEGNFIGTDGTGSMPYGNRRVGINVVDSDANVIGTDGKHDDNEAERNLVVGVAQLGTAGISISGANNRVAGNLIGTDLYGGAANGFGNYFGVFIGDGDGTIVGTNEDGLGDVDEGNVIANNASVGVVIQGDSTGNRLVGNLIGTDSTGSIAAANAEGVQLFLGTKFNLIKDNVISGNAGNGVFLLGPGADENDIVGNLIGTDVSGMDSLPNGAIGVRLIKADSNIIGGTSAAERNVISSNGGRGVDIFGSSNNTIVGNYIGLGSDALEILGNTNDGVVITPLDALAADSNQLVDNVISGNGRSGVVLGGNQNIVTGNRIGTDATGMYPRPNQNHGIVVSGGMGNRIGTDLDGVSDAAEANTVAFNTLRGITILNDSAVENPIRGNSIFQNGGIGIDLGGDGVTDNDPDANKDNDTGPNQLQNFPEISSVTVRPGGTAVAGVLNSAGNTTYRLEFYASSSCDVREGEAPLGSLAATTDGSGSDEFAGVLAGIVGAGQQVTATATDPLGNTSEFSACFADVVDPFGAINELIATVVALNLPNGLANSLLAKLSAALRSLNRGNEGAAVNQLEAFINEVEAQRGHEISGADVDDLIDDARVVIELIES